MTPPLVLDGIQVRAPSAPGTFKVAPEDGMPLLRIMFPDSEADYRNFVLFSTSGVHGSYLSIEEVAASLGTEEESGLTILIVQPRIVRMIYGTITITQEDVPFLLKLRETSSKVASEI